MRLTPPTNDTYEHAKSLAGLGGMYWSIVIMLSFGVINNKDKLIDGALPIMAICGVVGIIGSLIFYHAYSTLKRGVEEDGM